MDSPELRRKRKRLLRTPSLKSSSNLLSVRSLTFCIAIFTLLYVLSFTVKYHSSAFRPILVIPGLKLRSSLNDFQSFPNLTPSRIRIEDRVLFPDHVLLLVKKDGVIEKFKDGLVCVYESSILGEKRQSLDAFSVGEFDESRLVVRCPVPPGNYSSAASLRSRGNVVFDESDDVVVSPPVHSWEHVVYDAVLDGETAVVFVKGLNLRQERESDPGQFSCHFGLKNWEKDDNFMFNTRAVSAAQEVVRCQLPRSIKNSPEKAIGIRVTIGVTPYVHPRIHHGQLKKVILPSVAKISSSGGGGSTRRMMLGVEKKYEVCACTMLWNQAHALREWIKYHSWSGVEKWFIYDNNSDDNIDEVVSELEDSYNVSRHVWPWIKTQEAGFSHCAIRAKKECNWVAFMDVDEFFYFPNPNSGQNSLRAVVANVSSTSPNVAEIRTYCHSFGPSRLTSAPPKGVTVGYTCRMHRPERHKSIIRPEALDITLLNVVHHFHLKSNFTYLNLHQSIAVINHYKYQVWDVFKAKFYRRVATYVADWQENHNEGSRDRAPGLGTEAIEPPNWSHQFCEVWDTGLKDFVLANLVDESRGLLPWETSYSSDH